MAIKKISELSEVDCSDRTLTVFNRLSSSLFELSYAKNIDSPYQFKSVKANYGDLLSATRYEILGSPDTDSSDTTKHNVTNTDFYTMTTFHKQVDMEQGLNLSNDVKIKGNLTANFEQLKLSSTVITLSAGTLNIQRDTGVNAFFFQNDTTLPQLTSNTKITQNEDVNMQGDISLTGNITQDGNIKLTNPDKYCSISGNLSCYGTAYFDRDIVGCALSARWADLAEMYMSDAQYEPGTLVKFGGSAEITIADTEANAVITTRPGLVLGSNGEKTGLQGIALVGRVPVRVVGAVKKFDRLVLSETPGAARSALPSDAAPPVGVALCDSTGEKGCLVESAVRLSF